MKKRGAKSKYETLVKPRLEEINKKVRQWVTEAAIADALGISVASLNNYRNKHPEFAEVLSKGKGADVLNDLVNAGIESASGNNLVMNLVPCIYQEEVGMWDMVSNQFFGNVGEGAFVASAY